MLIPRPLLVALQTRLAELPAEGLRVVSVEADVDPLDLVRSGSAAYGFSAFFSSPEGRMIGALGSAARFGAHGPDRLAALDRQLTGLDPETPVLVGWSFAEHGPSGADWEGFPAATAVVPEVTVVRQAGRSRLTIAVPPGSDGKASLALVSTLQPVEPVTDRADVDQHIESRPAPADYVGLVDEACAAIKAGVMDKVVLARSVVVRRPIDPMGLVSRLRDTYPDCRVFAWQEDDAVFLGASPELLVVREDDHVRLSPLAGSAPRGPDAGEDRLLGEGLLGSDKDRREHELVVADAVERLAPLVGGLHRSPTPQLHRFATVQHLATTITGTTDARALELAGALHPTAAVGGSPRADAVGFIDKMEGLDRGWYAGGIGWVAPGGDGELAVALRCALVRGDQAILYAGNGIVEGSEPIAELEETRLKLRVLLDLLA